MVNLKKESTESSAPARAPSRVFSTDSLEPEGRFEIWREHFRPVSDVSVPTGGTERFAARSEHWQIGRVLFGETVAPTRRLVRTRADCARSGLDHWYVRVLRSGRIASCYDGNAVTLGPGRLFVGSFADTYDHLWSDGAWAAAILPRDVLADWGMDLAALRSPTPGGTGAAVLAEFLLSLTGRLAEATAAETTLLGDKLRGMLNACLFEEDAPRRVAPEDAALRRRAEAERVIRRDLASARLDVARIAERAGVSRSTLYRLFEQEGGVAAYVQEVRLASVRAALADPARDRVAITTLAEAHGFHCPASFSRAFRRRFGETPTTWRTRNRAARAERSRLGFGALLEPS